MLLVATEKEFSHEELRFLQRRKIHLWGERQLSYYEVLTRAIGEYAKYEIIHTFGIPTAEQTVKITVPALMLKQPTWVTRSNVELYLFTLPAETMLKIGAVLRRARSNAFTYQRILTQERLPRIGEFVSTANAILPTNLVVHLGHSVTVEETAENIYDVKGRKLTLWQKQHHLVGLTIPLEYASLEIIDGQHRIFGFVHSRKRTREQFNLVVVGIRNLVPHQGSKTFVAINDKAKRVDPSLVPSCGIRTMRRVARRALTSWQSRYPLSLTRGRHLRTPYGCGTTALKR